MTDATHTSPSRRRMLRLASGGAALALLGGGAAACEPKGAAQDDVKGGGDGPSSDTSGGKTKPGQPLWSKTVPVQKGVSTNELVALNGTAITIGDPPSAWDAKSGAKRWSMATGPVPGAPLLLGNDTLYLASNEYDGTVAGYDPATGKETWRSRLGKKFDDPRPIAVDDTQLYVIAVILDGYERTGKNVVAALDTASGRVVWQEQRDIGTEDNGLHAVVQGKHLIYTDFLKNLTVRDTATGQQVWTQKMNSINYDNFAVHEDLVIVAQRRELKAFAVGDGSVKWTVKTTEFDSFQVPAVLDGVLYVADSAHVLWAVDPATGEKIWQSKDLVEPSRAVPTEFTRAGDTLYGGTDLDPEGGVHAFDAKTGKLLWTFNDKSGDTASWRVAGDGTHVFALHADRLHALA
ncbi:Outer membrane protein assembly factor BamB [Streptomyces sp. RB5]|uniref:Outer membrane protein assembly factor BamB n=1 Tax=Streptomyces smaragdinus TaxID=2585196 RepID=A0A7K0CIG8_9ACTN|nr:PQQ-binding-like beta-propeller repeat protein [Streptomyces smaragdinus]MQY13258.1 Outer membrane protein assembly factor BamB [Streptomyces smaragdinus]